MELSRRGFLAAGAAALTIVPPARARTGSPAPATRPPGPGTSTQGFARYRLPLAKIERLGTGFRWCEGPVWFGDGRYLLWSDIPNNRVMKWEKRRAASASSASRRTTRTATRATVRGGSSPASTTHAA